MDASKITVCKQDMTVVRQEQLGLSPFGFLSKLFQEELEQRVRQQAGLGYGPVPLTLLEEEDGEEQTPPAQPLEVQLQLDIHLDAPKSADKKQPEKKPPARERFGASEIVLGTGFDSIRSPVFGTIMGLHRKGVMFHDETRKPPGSLFEPGTP